MRKDTIGTSQPKLKIIGVVVDSANASKKETVVAYRLFNTITGEIQVVRPDITTSLAQMNGLGNAEFTSGRIVGTEGSLQSMPKFDVYGKLIANQKVTILGVRESRANSNKARTYVVADAYGRTAEVDAETALGLIVSYKATNAKVVEKNGKKIISAIRGEFDTLESKEPENAPVKSDTGKSFSTERYVGKSVKSLIDVVDAHNNIAKLTQMIDRLEEYGEIPREADLKKLIKKFDNYGISRVLREISDGKFRTRTREHYKKTFAEMEKLGAHNIMEVASLACIAKDTWDRGAWYLSKLAQLRSGKASEVGELTKDTVCKGMRVIRALITDELIYARVGLSRLYIADLVNRITSSERAIQYLKENTDTDTEQSIRKAIQVSCKGKVTALSQLMYIEALEIVALDKILYGRGFEIEFSRDIMISKMYFKLKVEEKGVPQINKEEDYGKMLYHALLLTYDAPEKHDLSSVN